MTYPKVCLRRGEETGVRAGKPWIFENQLDWADDVCKDGGIVDVLDSRMRFAARGKAHPGIEHVDNAAVFADVVGPVELIFKDPRFARADAGLFAPAEADFWICHGCTSCLASADLRSSCRKILRSVISATTARNSSAISSA